MGPAGIGPSIRQDSLQVPGYGSDCESTGTDAPAVAQRASAAYGRRGRRALTEARGTPVARSKSDSRTVAAPAPRPARRPLSHPGQREGADSEARGTRHHCRGRSATVTGMPSVAPHVSARNYAEAWGRPGPH